MTPGVAGSDPPGIRSVPGPASAVTLLADARSSWTTTNQSALPFVERDVASSPWAASLADWWNLTTLSSRAPASSADFSMVYDAHDGYVVLFGGQRSGPVDSAETWLFSGGHWTLLTAATHPSAREGAFMAYDPSSAKVVLWGGVSISPSPMVHNDTWEFQAGAWTNVTTSVTGAPSARSIGSFAYSPADGGLILFGGADLVGSFNQTWKLAGHVWTRVTTTNAPSPRDLASMEYDPSSGYVMLFGGADITTGSPVANQETWKFSGGAWTLLSPGIAPPKRFIASMEYDAADGYLVLFGGQGTTSPLGDSWKFAAGLWTQLAPAHLPPASYYDGLAFDAADQYTVLFTGNVQTPSGLSTLNYTWAYTPALAAHPHAAAASFDLGASAQLTGNGSGGINPYTYSWEFGDGASGAGSVASHAYPRTGTFLVNLTVRDALGTLATSSIAIVVSPVPTAHASASAAATDSGVNVTFTCRAIGGTPPVSYTWKFGDGTTSSGSNLTGHLFSAAGTYHVVCTATDASGVSTNTTVAETISPLPTASASPSAPSTTPGVAVAFVGTASLGTPPYAFHWDFGDGTTATTQNVSKGFGATGSYTVTLTVTDSVGGVGRATSHVSVSAASSSGSTLLIVGIIGAVIVVGGVAGALLLRSRRKAGGDPSTTVRNAGGDPSSLGTSSASPPTGSAPPPPPPA